MSILWHRDVGGPGYGASGPSAHVRDGLVPGPQVEVSPRTSLHTYGPAATGKTLPPGRTSPPIVYGRPLPLHGLLGWLIVLGLVAREEARAKEAKEKGHRRRENEQTMNGF